MFSSPPAPPRTIDHRAMRDVGCPSLPSHRLAIDPFCLTVAGRGSQNNVADDDYRVDAARVKSQNIAGCSLHEGCMIDP